MATPTITTSLDPGNTAVPTITPAPASPAIAPAAPVVQASEAALPIALKVSFTLNTTDGLREISFGLEKDTDGITTDWIITFVLFERTDPSADFGAAVVSLSVFVAQHLQAQAETAANQGLTAGQAAHATGPAADAARAVNAGAIPLPSGNKIIQATLTAA